MQIVKNFYEECFNIEFSWKKLKNNYKCNYHVRGNHLSKFINLIDAIAIPEFGLDLSNFKISHKCITIDTISELLELDPTSINNITFFVSFNVYGASKDMLKMSDMLRSFLSAAEDMYKTEHRKKLEDCM
jgi:hypothetical protein